MFDLSQDLPGNVLVRSSSDHDEQSVVDQQLQLQTDGNPTNTTSSDDEDEPDQQHQTAGKSLESRITLPSSASNSRKRKLDEDPEVAAAQALATKRTSRLAADAAAKKHVLSGAGSRIVRGSEMDSAGVREARSRKYDKKGREVVADLPLRDSKVNGELDAGADDTDDDDEMDLDIDDEDEDDGDVIDNNTKNLAHDNNLQILQNQQDNNHDKSNGSAKPKPRHKAFHMITKYRPILGIIPLAKLDAWELATTTEKQALMTEQQNATDGHNYEPSDVSLEVAVVERPGWELELGERFVGRNEREDLL